MIPPVGACPSSVGPDNYWSLSRMSMSEEATLNVIGRDILPQELSLEFKDGYWTVLGEKRLVVMSKERQAIVDALRASKRPSRRNRSPRPWARNRPLPP